MYTKTDDLTIDGSLFRAKHITDTVSGSILANQGKLCAGYRAAFIDTESFSCVGLGKPVLLLGIVDMSHAIPGAR